MSNPEIPPDPLVKVRRRLALLLLGLTLLVAAMAGLYAYLAYTAERELREALAEADEMDPGWRLEDLRAKRAVVPDEENGARTVLAALAKLPADWPFWEFPGSTANPDARKPGVRISKQMFWSPEPPVRLEEHLLSALRAELQRAAPALLALRSIVQMPQGRYPDQSRAFDTLRMGRLLAYDALLREEDEDWEGALTSCHGILNVSRSRGDELALFSMLVRRSLDRLAARSVERILAQGQPSEAALSSMQKELAQVAEQPLLLVAARAERAGMDDLLQAVQRGETDLRSVLMPSQNLLQRVSLMGIHQRIPALRAAMLKRNNQFVALAKLPVEQQIGPLRTLQAAEEQLPTTARLIAAPIFPTVMDQFYPACTELRCAVAMLAAERYRQAHGVWPTSLTELTPVLLSTVPIDPYDGKPLRYRQCADGVAIYSIGPDGQDDGGTFDRMTTTLGTDIGFRLWEPARRRQPPKSAVP